MIENSDIFEIRFYNDEYTKSPIAVCKPDVFDFVSTLDKVSKKKLVEKNIEQVFNKVCAQTNLSLRWKLSNGIVACIAVKDNVSENEMLQYINQGIEQQVEPKKRSYHKRSPEEIAQLKSTKIKRKAGRPKGAKNKKQKISVKKKTKGKPGRPSLPIEEKLRRAKEKAEITKRSGGKRGRPKNKKSA
jgi:hypothetical protein